MWSGCSRVFVHPTAYSLPREPRVDHPNRRIHHPIVCRGRYPNLARGASAHPIAGRNLNLIGVDDSQPDIKGIKHLVMSDTVNILLVHSVGRADFERTAEFGIDLTLMGHTHGGQLSLEFLRRGLSFARLETHYVRDGTKNPAANSTSTAA